MQQTDRPRKVDVVVLGRGLLAATLALLVAERGKKVALLVEGDEAVDPTVASMMERINTFEKCYAVVGTRVRGISVIENGILGAIAEDARYDSRIVVNLAEDARHAAFARMMHQSPTAYTGAARIVPTTVTGGWHLEGTVNPATIPDLAVAAVNAIVSS
jgi:thioredoxin reductase